MSFEGPPKFEEIENPIAVEPDREIKPPVKKEEVKPVVPDTADALIRRWEEGQQEAQSESVENAEISHPEDKKEKGEVVKENILEGMFEIPESVREKIHEITSSLEDVNLLLQEYETEVNANKLPDKYSEYDPKISEIRVKLNKLRSRAEYGIRGFTEKFGYKNYFERLPDVRQAQHYRQEHREVQYLPETIEAAFLANDAHFADALDEVILRVEKFGLSDYKFEDKSLLPNDHNRWETFLKLFAAVPRDSEERIRQWLLAPATRVAHSMFSHVTSESALAEILQSGSLKSPNLVPNAYRTGAHSASSDEATPLEKSAVYFDQNSISHTYGVSESGPVARRVWLITRGDRLLNYGMLDRKTFEDRHPFHPGRVSLGTAVASIDKGGTEIPLSEFIIEIPRGAEDLKQQIKATLKDVVIFEYDPELYNWKHPQELDITDIQAEEKRLKEKFGFAKVPNMALSAVNVKEQVRKSDYSTYEEKPIRVSLAFPQTINLRPSK